MVKLVTSLCVGVAAGTIDELAVLRPDLQACRLLLVVIPGHVLDNNLVRLDARF